MVVVPSVSKIRKQILLKKHNFTPYIHISPHILTLVNILTFEQIIFESNAIKTTFFALEKQKLES